MVKSISTQDLAESGALWDRVIAPQALWIAWQRVRANAGGAGGDGVRWQDFERGAWQRIERLSDQIASGHYAPGPYRPVAIPKKSGGERLLAIPCIADRVVQTSTAMALTQLLDPGFEPSSFAYRPGRGVAQAVQAVLRHRRDGYRWAAEGDIERCFDEIPHEPLLERLEAEAGDARLTDLVALWLSCFAPAGIGIPQGSPISPLLCNLHLDAIDEAMVGSGVRLVRYADDFVILAKSAGRAEAALGEMEQLLRGHGLALNPDKSRIVAAEQALRFLGHVFVRSMAWKEVEAEADVLPAPPDAPPEEVLAQWAGQATVASDADDELPDPRPSRRRPLFLVEPGALLTVRNHSFVVEGPPTFDPDTGEPKREGHLVEHAVRIDRIEIGPGAEADWKALQLAAACDIPLAMVDGWGATAGWLTGPGDLRGARVLAQARWLADDVHRNALAAAVVRGRVRNQWKILRRLNRARKDERLAKAAVVLRRIQMRLPKDVPAAQALGYEGAAGAQYWPAIGYCIPAAFGFAGLRERRPPPDPVNAALGYLYALLERDIRVAIERAGLHPGMGALHIDRDGDGALVYDLMEAFRAPVSETILTTLIGRKALRAEMFTAGAGLPDGGRAACRIELAGRRALIQGHESWLARPIRSRRSGKDVLWRALFDEEARALADLFTGQAQAFIPYEIDF